MFDNSLLRFRKDINYIFLDCETYNLNLSFNFNVPWEIEILKSIGTKTIESKNILINWLNEKPDLMIEPEVAIKNHYSKEKVQKEGLEPKKAFYKFWQDLKDCQFWIAHNALNFDLYLLKEYAKYMGEDWKFLLNKCIDTNALAKGMKLGIKYDLDKENLLEYQMRTSSIIKKGLKTNLAAMSKEFGIEIKDETMLHSAGFDVFLNKQVFEKLIWMVEI